MQRLKKLSIKGYPVLLVVSVTLLSLAGVFLLYLSGDEYHMKRQLIGLLIGLFALVVVSLIDYHNLLKFSWPYYVVIVILLVLVRFSSLGEDQGTGAYRWLNLGFVDLQISEFAKLALIFALASLFTKYKDKVNKPVCFLLACLVAVVPTFLIMIQTDLSSSMVMMFIFAVMFFAAGLSYKIIGIVAAIGVPLSVALVWYVQQPWQSLLSSRQQERILGFFNPEEFAASYMYQQNRSVAAIASGGLAGKFLEGSENPTQLSSKVYVNESDFIFSVAGETLGFLGCLILILLLAFLVIKCLMTARKAKDQLGYLVAVGISAMFMFQVFVNIGVATSLLPNTGLPLPFLSYGLSSLVSSMIAVGFICNVGLQRKRQERF